MKRLFGLSWLVLGWSVCVYAQTDPGRDLSKYADDKFREDDKYTVATPYETVTVKQPKSRKVKNVIVMIGDGMCMETVTVGWTLNGGHLNLDNFPVAGYSRTWCADKLITDSCAGGTAISSGAKTKYGYIGQDVDGNPFVTLLHRAQQKGMRTGVAVTCRINDATPADFVCHAPDRHMEAEIAAQFVDSGVDFITGGGRKFWEGREDGRNLIEEMKAKGYNFVEKREELAGIHEGKVLGLFAPLDMDPVLDRGPVLEDCTAKALELLDNRKGFFLMIEGSQIDDWAHRNKVGHMAEELFDFDRCIGKVLEFAEKDGHTLVIVTADHGTGGITLVGGSLEERSVKVHYSTKGHHGIVVPVFAYGPHAEDFIGVYENAELSNRIRKLMK
ncbi:MAG: alkaline phosphatase [Bacteroidales bacterium]|nr:alkaline phosphatase [Bacteroidales bacterium]